MSSSARSRTAIVVAALALVITATVGTAGLAHASPQADLASEQQKASQLEAEIEAQFDAFRATGLALDHVNTHKHFHLHPTIASAIVRIGRRYGMRAIRVPLEPSAVLRKADPKAKLPAALATAPWALLARARFRALGLRVPDQVFGLAWSGAMSARHLLGLIEHLPDGLSEIYLHPATGPYPGSAPGYAYAEELAALTAPRVIEAFRHAGIAKGGFADF